MGQNGTRKGVTDEQTVQTLQAMLDTANFNILRLTGVLAAVLIAKHDGKVLIDSITMDMVLPESMAEAEHGYLVKVDTLKGLNVHRVQACTPDGNPYVPASKPDPAAEMQQEASPACPDEWHRNGTGLRCPLCGSSARIV